MSCKTEESISSKLPALLDEDKYQEAIVLVNQPENESHLKQEAWDIVPHLCDPMTKENELEKPELIQTCEDILIKVSEIANPKEVLLVLLEQVDSFKDDVKFKGLLLPIQKCLLRLPAKRGHSLAIALETLYAHFLTIEEPKDVELDGKERVLLDCDENVQRCNDTVEAMLNFLKPFVEELDFRKNTSHDQLKNKKQVDDLLRIMVRMLNRPLALLDLTYLSTDDSINIVKSKSRLLVEKLMHFFECLEPDSLKYLKESLANNQKLDYKRKKLKKEPQLNGDALDELEVEEPIELIGLAVLSYLLYGEGLGTNFSPSIVTHEYSFEFNVVFIKLLLSQSKTMLVEKGAILLESSINLIRPATMSIYYLDQENFKELLMNLVNVVCAGRIKETCKKCVKLIGKFYKCFTPAGRHRYLLFMFNKFHHSGFMGYIITLLKDELENNLGQTEHDLHFKGQLLEAILNHVFSLPDGETSDLLQNSEWVMGALNLLRYLIIRDVKNVTGIWDVIPKLQSKYLECLHKGIQISRAHYQLDLEKLKKGESPGMPELAFSVGNESMPGLSRQQQEDMMHMAIHTFDMMESVLGRVNELIEQLK